MLKNIDKIIDIFVAPVMLFSLGMLFIILASIEKIPQKSNLSERQGHLDSFYFQEQCHQNNSCDYLPIITLKEGTGFWIDALGEDKYYANNALKNKGIELKFFVDQNSHARPINNAVKGYGLWINGQQIESVDSALNKDKIAVYFYFPALAISFFILAAFLFNRNLKKHKNKVLSSQLVPLNSQQSSEEIDTKKIMLVDGWTEDQLRKILGDFGNLYRIKDNLTAVIKVKNLKSTKNELKFPHGIDPMLFIFLINYSAYPFNFDLKKNRIAVAAKTKLTGSYQELNQKLVGQEAILYIPENDKAHDIVCILTEQGDSLCWSISKQLWSEIDINLNRAAKQLQGQKIE